MVEENWVSYKDKLTKFYSYSIEEWRNFLVVSLFFAFIFSFREWSIVNFIQSLIISAIMIYVHNGAQRIHALRLGYKPEFKTWPYGIIGSLILCFITNGIAAIPIYGGTEIHMMLKHRLGKFRYGLNMVNVGLIAMMGPLANIIFAYIIKLVNLIFHSAFLERMVLLNLLFAVWIMLPIPPLTAGARIFFWSRMSYIFIYGTFIAAAILIWYSNNFFFILIGSLFVGAILWFVYYVSYEESGGFST